MQKKKEKKKVHNTDELKHTQSKTVTLLCTGHGSVVYVKVEWNLMVKKIFFAGLNFHAFTDVLAIMK